MNDDDQLTGAVELESYPEGRVYWCDLVFDNPTDAFDCKTDVPVGLKQSITSGGLLDCVCKATGSIGFPNCSYDCVTAN